MKYELIIPARVRVELKTASAWYSDRSGSSEVGANWYAGFLTALATLKINPQRCGLAHESDTFPYEVRVLLYGSGKRKTHRALFRIVSQQVQLLSIRHHDLTPDDL